MPVGWSAARCDFNGADPQAIAVAALLGVDDPAREPSQSLLDVPAGNRAEIEDHGRTRRSDVLLHDELAAAREGVQGRVLAVVQPHRFTRLRDLMTEFQTAFNDADTVYVAPVYAAGEAPLDDAAPPAAPAEIKPVE